ncbi:hypothetical protein [Methylomonas sp. UP202]|uniref:hypothetical protein n=1 Tax=Methylomonas sp. UP202 TaxID=3040943 RepID=UPI00247A2C3E|nr:hypothetical protein [Methylomonas sp. UP202]WGS88685.1 hypothetical protein QC632_24715 [Methylomonas sp. UP202]
MMTLLLLIAAINLLSIFMAKSGLFVANLPNVKMIRKNLLLPLEDREQRFLSFRDNLIIERKRFSEKHLSIDTQKNKPVVFFDSKALDTLYIVLMIILLSVIRWPASINMENIILGGLWFLAVRVIVIKLSTYFANAVWHTIIAHNKYALAISGMYFIVIASVLVLVSALIFHNVLLVPVSIAGFLHQNECADCVMYTGIFEVLLIYLYLLVLIPAIEIHRLCIKAINLGLMGWEAINGNIWFHLLESDQRRGDVNALDCAIYLVYQRRLIYMQTYGWYLLFAIYTV